MKQYQWFPGHMAKALKEIDERIKVIDVVLVLLDARAPYSSLNPKLQGIIQHKPTIYILTKRDLADQKITNQWLNYFKKEESKAIAIDVNHDNLNVIDKEAEVIMAPKFAREKAKGIKPRAIRYLVVGIPNVGKSTLINRLAKRKATVTANRPGVTKAQQYIKVNERMELLDTPGVLWPNFDDNTIGTKLAMIGTIKQDILPQEDLALQILNLLTTNYPLSLQSYYEIIETPVLDEKQAYNMLNEIGLKRGFLLKGNNVDITRSITTLIKDFQSGKVAKVSLEIPGNDTWQTVGTKTL
ncbi:MAG: ribosome biogenesis GTPase YlqF [Bacilli bacterium]|nr:ribosome biogenesis GTPase YlqF [Bacilli bacterium]MDD3422839.1 ribosome biogenesis GTPase YlqF [Bacilli bacterium]MDD4065759.1 ribosome biogenesis GTPase YlqF [Bacilli bacterium]